MNPVVFGAPVRTDRLVLRMMTAADVDDIVEYQGRADVCRYLLYEAQTRDQVAERIGRYSVATTLAKDGDYWQTAVELPASGDGHSKVIGDIYFTVKSTEHATGEIGWVLSPEFHGRGYAREAASAIIDRAFGDVGLHRVIAEIDPRNDASANLCRALGMREEAYFVEDMMFRGDWADTGIYAILAREWHERSSAGSGR